MIYIDNHEYVAETNKLHIRIVNLEVEFENRRNEAYENLARYIRTYQPKDWKALIIAPNQPNQPAKQS